MKLEEFKKIEFQRQKAAALKEREALAVLKAKDATLREAKLAQALRSKHQQKPSLGVFSPLRKVEKRCPKLAEHAKDPEFSRALDLLMARTPIRKLEDWKPQGKAQFTLFASLASHLLAKYRVPHFLWRAFFYKDQGHEDLLALAIHVASGGSLYEWVKAGVDSVARWFHVPLTRKMCHEFLAGPEPSKGIVANLRAAQVLTMGGTRQLWNALEPTGWGQSLVAFEDFYAAFVLWLTKQAMLDLNQVRPMYDYVTFKRNEDANWSLKGRNAVTLIRDMETWHAGLQKAKVVGHRDFPPSGIKDGIYEFQRPGYMEIWRMREILTAKALNEEGKRQNHCVFSYARRIESGHCSIWTLTKEDQTGNWAMLTVEVLNGPRSIAQVRGRFNRLATSQERTILMRWCTEAGVSGGYL